MRIHLTISPNSIATLPKSEPGDPPLVSIGKDLVMVELQGELKFEGEGLGKVIGVLGFERMVRERYISSQEYQSEDGTEADMTHRTLYCVIRVRMIK